MFTVSRMFGATRNNVSILAWSFLRRMFVVTVVNAWCGFSIHAWILVCRFLCMPLLERMFVTMERRGTSCFQSKSCLDSGMPLWERMHVSGLCGRASVVCVPSFALVTHHSAPLSHQHIPLLCVQLRTNGVSRARFPFPHRNGPCLPSWASLSLTPPSLWVIIAAVSLMVCAGHPCQTTQRQWSVCGTFITTSRHWLLEPM